MFDIEPTSHIMDVNFNYMIKNDNEIFFGFVLLE
jgi:hypothetical protein